jgi:hypothetical protein
MANKPRQKPVWADEKYITPNYGLGHTPLFNLRKAGKIRSISTKGEGQKYGKRLYHIPSIEEYFASQEAREIQEVNSAIGGSK